MKGVSNEITQEAEEAARIINEYRQKLTEVIGEEKEGLRKKAEQESAVIIVETKQKLGQIIDAAKRETKKELENRDEPVEFRAVITEEGAAVVEPVFATGDNSVARKVGNGKLYQGTLELDITPPLDSGQMGRLEEHLHQIPDLQLLLADGSADEKARLTVFIAKPLPLISFLKEMLPVTGVVQKQNFIEIMQKTSADSK